MKITVSGAFCGRIPSPKRSGPARSVGTLACLLARRDSLSWIEICPSRPGRLQDTYHTVSAIFVLRLGQPLRRGGGVVVYTVGGDNVSIVVTIERAKVDDGGGRRENLRRPINEGQWKESLLACNSHTSLLKV